MSVSSQNQLPFPFDPLIGRERDVAVVADLVRASPGRIVTLTGPGGVGKTRLAIAVADTLQGEFVEGPVSVDLASLTEAAQVAPSILQAIGQREVVESGGQLATALAGQSLLLVLDNFEHLLDGALILNAALSRAPNVRVLVTSRTPLEVSGERDYLVEPLPVPLDVEAGELGAGEFEEISQSPSVALFVSRAQSIFPEFRLTPGNAASISAICRQLDGLPLAIELAAARTRVLSPEALLTRLRVSARLLGGGPLDAADRHRSLELAIGWSYDLLQPREALLLERLSVFAGSFGLAAAEAVAGDAPILFAPSVYLEPLADLPADHRLPASDVFDLLDRLVGHSLVQRVDDPGQEPRFRIFETVRQFAAERLQRSGDQTRVAMRHARYFRARAEAIWYANGSPVPEVTWFRDLHPERDNLRVALDFTDAHDPAASSSFAAALDFFFYNRLVWKEGLRAMERPAGRFDPADLPTAAQDRFEIAYGMLLAFFDETQAEGLARLDQLASRADPAFPQWAPGYAGALKGIVESRSGGDGLAAIAAARVRLGSLESGWTDANLRYHESLIRFERGEIEQAKTLARSVTETDPSKAGISISYARHVLGLIGIAEHRPIDAAFQIHAGLDLMTRYGLDATWTEEVDTTAAIAAIGGAPDLAAVIFGAADRMHRDAGFPVVFPARSIYQPPRDQARADLGAERFDQLHADGMALPRTAVFPLVLTTLERLQHAEPSLVVRLGADDPYGLTARERQALRLVAMGFTDREIGQQMGISHATARARVRSILAKLGVPSRTAATTVALREGIVSLTETD